MSKVESARTAMTRPSPTPRYVLLGLGAAAAAVWGTDADVDLSERFDGAGTFDDGGLLFDQVTGNAGTDRVARSKKIEDLYAAVRVHLIHGEMAAYAATIAKLRGLQSEEAALIRATYENGLELGADGGAAALQTARDLIALYENPASTNTRAD